MPYLNSKLVAALLAGALVSSSVGEARADDVDEAVQKIIHLDQRVHIMALEFNEAPVESVDLPDRRVLEAQALLGLGRTDEATTLLLDVMVRWPRSLAARDATFELADALYSQHDYLSARRYYERAVTAFTGTKRERRALVQLIEIALRTGDFEHVDGYLGLLAKPTNAALEPAVAYVEGKVLYYRGNPDEAKRIFASIAPASPYSWQARYFVGTIMVKSGDLDGAAKVYEALSRTPVAGGAAREIQDLSRLALGRISYERGQVERAAAVYRSIAADSKVFADALYELGWTYVRSRDFPGAERAFGRLLGLEPDGLRAPEVKLLVANLHLRQGDLELARAAFSRARDELDPFFQKLKAVIVRSQADPVFHEILTSRRLEEIDLAAFVPVSAQGWVRADPEVEHVLTLARDVTRAQTAVADINETFERIQGVLTDVDRLNRLALFPDLKRARRGSTDALVELVVLRAEFARRARRLVQPLLPEVDGQLLDQNAADRAVIEQELGAGWQTAARPTTTAVDAGAARGQGENRRASTSMLVARDSSDPLGQLLDAVLRLERPAPGASPVGTTGEQRAPSMEVFSGAREQPVAERLRALSRQDLEVLGAARARGSAAARGEVDRALGVVTRADAAVDQLLTLDARLDAEADVRVAALEEVVVARRRDVVAVTDELAVVVSKAQSLGGSLAQVMYTRVADRMYDLIVRADVGLIDVAWGRKARRSTALQTLLTKRGQEEGALQDELGRQEAALSRHLAAATSMIKRLSSSDYRP
jgi:TolA-binding protein